jgi:hypothetical protein
MSPLLSAISVAFALVAAFMAASARSTERLLWGSLLCSIFLGLAVEAAGHGYYGIMMIAVFLVTDLVIYLFFRTQALLPARASSNRRTDRLFRIFFLWLAFCGIAGAGLAIFNPYSSMPWSGGGNRGVALLHERLWSDNWLFILIPLISLVVLVVGGFFLVRRER